MQREKPGPSLRTDLQNAADRRQTKAASSRIAGLARFGLIASLGLTAAACQPGHAARTTDDPGGAAAARIGGPFQMTDQNGRSADQSLLLGKWSAVFFGYTYCPDTCPATLQALAAAMSKLGPDAQQVQVVFVSVDPARDTPAKMKLYLSAQGFPGRAIGLTGSPAQVAVIAKRYGVYYEAQPSDKGAPKDAYLVAHTAAIYLMSPQGRFVRPLDQSQSPQGLADQIRAAIRGA